MLLILQSIKHGVILKSYNLEIIMQII